MDCSRQTFREPLTVAMRYQRRTARLAIQVGHVVRELAGRAGARVLTSLGVGLSRQTALRALLRVPVPERPVPAVIGVDDLGVQDLLWKWAGHDHRWAGGSGPVEGNAT